MKSVKSIGAAGGGACQVAIIGMGCIFPKAGDLKTFWENILTKVDAITEVPGERWDWRDYFDADKKARDKIYSRWGGFIDPIIFNPAKYGIPPQNLKAIDPVQLLSLEVAARALRDAGYLDREFDRERTATIFGLAGGMGDFGLQYGFRASLPMFFPEVPEEILSQLPEWTEDSFPGVLPNVVTGRIANTFNLGGPNFTVDAACASALTGVYLAVKEILSGVATMAIVGAADTLQNPHGFLCFSKCSALTPSGKPKPFDENADGICISEGLGALILKRLDLAEKDGDRIYAVIRGVGSSSDGKGKSLTAPRREGQLLALDRAYGMAGFGIETVGLVEAHGTGTVVGDGTEAESVVAAYKEAGASAKSCAIGSVKSQIGHTKGCAGVAGLIKAALSLHYKVLPPTINVARPGAASILDPASPLYVNTAPRPWIAGEGPRRAGVNSFGFGGTNFHCVVEEHTAKSPHDIPLETWPSELFVWSGDTAAAIAQKLEHVETALPIFSGALRDLSSAVWSANQQGALRLALVAESVADLAGKIGIARKSLAANPATIKDPRGIFFSARPLNAHGKIAFLMPGQGSQRPDMTRDLTILFPELRDGFARADAVLKDRLPKKLSEYVFPPPRFSAEEEDARLKEITVTNIAQPSLGVVELGLHRILGRFGVRPEMLAGHSSGEYAALCAAGVFDEETLYEILEDRGSSIIKSCEGDLGTMLATKGSAKEVEELIKGLKGVYVANFNSPSQTILSGLKADLEKASIILEAKGIKTRFIPVACAFHSPIIEPARDFLGKKLAAIDYAKPSVPVYANVLATPYTMDKTKMREVLTDHLIAPVRFAEQIQNMHKDGARIFIEVGPGNVLTNLVAQILEGKEHVAIATDSKAPRHDIVQLQLAFAQMLAEGVGVNLAPLFEGRRINAIDPSTLKPLKADEKPNPVCYMVAPDRAWPISQSRPLRRKVPMVPAARLDEERARSANELSAARAASPQVAAATATSPLASLMLQQQQMMSQFLQQQRDLMLAILGNRPAAPRAAAPQTPAISKDWKKPEPKLPTLGTAAPKPAPAIAPPAAASAGSLEKKLVDLVASRTGYPPEMLGLDLNIESDLGIDSIKKMEVLIAFTKEIPGAPDDLPEKLSAAKSLREVLAQSGSVAAPAIAVSKEWKKPEPKLPTIGNAAPPAVPTVAAQSGSLETKLVELVASRTGYPPEMLGLDLNIESDLGIDSIKKMEILIAFAKEISGAADDLPEKLSAAKSLREILKQIDGASGSSAAVAKIAPVVAATKSEKIAPLAGSGVIRNLVHLVESPLGAGAKVVCPKGVVIITDDGGGIAAGVAKAIEKVGGKTQIVSLKNTKLTDSKSVERAVAEIREKHGSIGGLVHLLPLRAAPAVEKLSADGWRQNIAEDVKSLFYLLRAIAPDLKASKDGWAFAATSLGAAASNNGFLPQPAQAWLGGVMGIMKCAADEWPGVVCKVIDSDVSSPDVVAPLLLAEAAAGRDTKEVYYRGGKRWFTRTVSTPFAVAKARIEIKPDDVILVIGGARGITGMVADEIATRSHPTIILAGRSKWPVAAEPARTANLVSPADIKKVLFDDATQAGEKPKPADLEKACQRILQNREMRAAKSAMEKAGSKVFYHSVDVSDGAALSALVKSIYEKHGRLDGVINGAGVIEDKLIEDKTPESFDRVFDIKVNSVFALSRALRPDALKFLVLFSSIAGWYGNRGQSDYAAANEIMNRMAMNLTERWQRRVVAIGWGPWDQTGMATEQVKKQFKERGVGLVQPDAGRRFCVDEILYGPAIPSEAIIIAEGALS